MSKNKKQNKELEYYIPVSKQDYKLHEILDYFMGYRNLSKVSNLSYSTVHHAFHYKGITNTVAMAIEKHSHGKYKALDVVGMKFASDKPFSFENIKRMEID